MNLIKIFFKLHKIRNVEHKNSNHKQSNKNRKL